MIKETTTRMTTFCRLTRFRRHQLMAALAIALGGLALATASPAAAAPAAPGWGIYIVPTPTNFTPGDASGVDAFTVTVANIGAGPTAGTFTITDTLPTGVTLDPAGPGTAYTTATCSENGETVTCTDSSPLSQGGIDQITIPVDVSATAPGTITDSATVSGGGATSATATVPTTVSATPAGFGFLPGPAGLHTVVSNADGSPDEQAGSHPSMIETTFNLNTSLREGAPYPSDHIRDATVQLPAGMIINGDATAAKCTEAQLETDQSGGGCPPDSQVGFVSLTTQSLYQAQPLRQPLYVNALYNMVPIKGVSTEFAFDAGSGSIYVHYMGGIDTGGTYAEQAGASWINAKYQLTGVTTVFFGQSPGSSIPLLTMPSACSSTLDATVTADSWENPGVFSSDTAPILDQNGNPVSVSGCDREDFTPSMSVTPDTSVADSPSGLSVDLSVPQSQNAGGLAEADLKAASVSLPVGMSINPASANGLGSCTPSEIGMNNAAEPSCPDASKIGTVEVDTPLLSDPMTGGIYVAQQKNNPFDSLLAIYVTAEADGALIKLAGQITADPVTGQLTTTFDSNPPLPFSDFKLDFWGGPGAVLTSPQSCGTYSWTGALTPFSGNPAVDVGDSFPISSGCVTGFKPSFSAGSENAQAGAYSPFVVEFGRQDADQFFSGLSATLPEGVLAKLAGVGECTAFELAAAAAKTGAEEQADPSCPESSQVGTVETGAGSGSDPYYLQGKVYLTGPYKGAPFGLAVVVPAVAGPYDLGTVVIRQQLQINPNTAQVTVVSDPFPTILQGIPLQIRSVTVTMNRSDFTVNPTSCDVMSTTGTLTSTAGSSAPVRSRFQVGGCAALGFSPKLKISLTGKGQTKSGQHPNLIANYTIPAGDANTHSVVAKLPISLALDPNNSQVVCPYATAQAVTTGPANCPADTQVGTATADTPLLSQPLTGPVYLVQGLSFKDGVETHTLPTLLVTLRGQIALNLRAQTSVSHGRLVSTFGAVPDAPVSKFQLTITGGKLGILVITGRGRSICNKPQTTAATMTAQSGKQKTSTVKMSTPCRRTHH